MDERGAYVRRLEAAWADQGARLAALDATRAAERHAPWRTAARQTVAALRARLPRARP